MLQPPRAEFEFSTRLARSALPLAPGFLPCRGRRGANRTTARENSRRRWPRVRCGDRSAGPKLRRVRRDRAAVASCSVLRPRGAHGCPFLCRWLGQGRLGADRRQVSRRQFRLQPQSLSQPVLACFLRPIDVTGSDGWFDAPLSPTAGRWSRESQVHRACDGHQSGRPPCSDRAVAAAVTVSASVRQQPASKRFRRRPYS